MQKLLLKEELKEYSGGYGEGLNDSILLTSKEVSSLRKFNYILILSGEKLSDINRFKPDSDDLIDQSITLPPDMQFYKVFDLFRIPKTYFEVTCILKRLGFYYGYGFLDLDKVD